jgi:SAM-dependent methyltransferase
MDSNKLALDPKELVTLEMYNKTAQKWATTSDGKGLDGVYLWGEAMEKFNALAALEPWEGQGRQRLLEIGSGTGRDAKLLSKLYEYVGTDPAASFIEVARQATAEILPADAFQQMSVYDLKNKFPPGSFDLFWCCATLLHCSKDRMHEALRSIRSVMKDGAVGFISLKEGDGEEEDKFDGIPRYFMYWRQEEFAIELSRARFRIVGFFKKPARKDFLCYFVQKV